MARFAALTGPVPLWNSVAVQVSAAQGMSLSENARLFALLNIAICDASIAVFQAKYFYHYWRPVTAIRAGGTDGNPGTEPDPAFTPFVTTPAYPSYPSGHGGIHFRFEQDEAELLGRRVARYVHNINLRCLHAERCVDAENNEDHE